MSDNDSDEMKYIWTFEFEKRLNIIDEGVKESFKRRAEGDLVHFWIHPTLLFTLVPVTDNEVLQTEQLHPLPSFQDYRTNSSVRAYQTGYFPSGCAQEQGMGAGQVFEVNLGAGLDRLGGPCDSEEDHDNDHNSDLYHFCDGPLKPKTAYR